MLETEKSVTEVAAIAGYRQKFGRNPNALRKN